MQTIDWQSIINKHGPVVWRTAYRLLGNYADSADCFQETFISALEIRRNGHIHNFKALLTHLATVRAIDKLRHRFYRSKNRINMDVADLDDIAGGQPAPEQKLQSQELSEKLRQSLSQLQPQEAEIFCMRYLDNFSYRRIGKQLKINTNTVGVLLHRARVKLKILLEESPPQEKVKEVVL
ncbi:MAG: sigma-70 family RNA polymerase sigma factor [Planctomycetes bacterium]|nr:sigma-70 family RNA polymerase sigma factor [Planctomycetota bacterium]